MKKRLQSRAGFTLVETVVTLTLFTMIVALTCGIFLTSNNLLRRHATMNEAKFVGDTVYGMLNRTLTYATELQLTGPDGTQQYNSAFSVSGGQLMLTGQDENGHKETGPFYDESFYLNTKIALSARVERGRYLWLRVSVYDWDGKTLLYETAATTEILNLRLAAEQGAGRGTEIEDDFGGAETASPVISFDSDLIVHVKKGTLPPSTLQEYVNAMMDGFYADQQRYQNMADYLPAGSTQVEVAAAKQALEAEMKNKYGCYNANSLSNDLMRKKILTRDCGGRWPLFQGDPAQYAPVPGKGLAALGQLEVQFHWDKGPAVSQDDDSVILYAVVRKESDATNNASWRPELIYNPYDGKWYTKHPTQSHPQASSYLPSLTITPRVDRDFFDAVAAQWNPLE